MQENNPEIVVGIDLGTTNSEIAFIYKNKPMVLKIDGSKIVPSVVSVDSNGHVLVGKPALNNELLAPKDTISWIKRKMGREEIIPLGGQSYTPSMVSSLILLRLKRAAEEFLQQPISKAVITVPAFFNEKQREVTKEAAELAGLEPIRLLNEPTAAALAYASDKNTAGRCLVYDLGGGTFDVSIVDFSNQFMEVKASHGDTELGGTDFDKMIADKARQAFLKDYEIDLAKDPLSWARLMRAAEAAKIRLSTEAITDIIEEFITTDKGNPLHLKYSISRVDFEEMIRATIERTLISVRKALEMASLTNDQIDRVILVGGSTYIPLVTEILEKELKIVPQAWIDPSTVVGMGAAIEAAKLSGQKIGPMMLDVTPHSLGVECMDEDGSLINHILIRRNTPLPSVASHVFYKAFRRQMGVEVKVYQGESIYTHQNHFLGSFNLDDIEGDGMEVYIKFELDWSGILHVTASHLASGKQMQHTLKRISNSRVKHASLADLETVHLSTEELDELNELEELEELEEFDEEQFLLNEEGFASLEASIIEEVVGEMIDKSSLEEQELLERAKKLSESPDLDKTERDELSNELVAVQTGDKDALKRLSNLMYYIE